MPQAVGGDGELQKAKTSTQPRALDNWQKRGRKKKVAQEEVKEEEAPVEELKANV